MAIEKDLKKWYALSCPTTGLRFDARTLELLDTDRDGHIRYDEVRAAVDYLSEHGVDVLASRTDAARAEDEKKLADVMARLGDLSGQEPSDLEKAARTAWETDGQKPDVAVCGPATGAAEAALATVESLIDGYFTPADDMPLVTEDPDVELPLTGHLNPRHLEAMLAFGEQCVKPVLGARDRLTRMEWKRVKAAFAPYRAWRAAEPVMHAVAKAQLEDEERLLRYKLHLGEFLANFVTMDRLFTGSGEAMFQTGTLNIDGREMSLCFHVAAEAAHAALAAKSKCCLLYLKLTQPETSAERMICTVVTAGLLTGLYAGRRGVFRDREGAKWQAVVTQVIESQISLAEAFWAPWRKLGEALAGTVKKFLGDRQASSLQTVKKGTESAQAGGAALASSVAAVGIGIGMVGAAAASIMAAVSSMSTGRLVLSLVVIVLLVSLPSVILTWFKLRARDLAAILNACGWAANRPIRFSMARARTFTKCVPTRLSLIWLAMIVIVVAVLAATVWCHRSRSCAFKCNDNSCQQATQQEKCK